MIPLEIVPHPKAPLFSNADAQIVMQQVLSEVKADHGNDETLRQAFRQAGFVNLWFFLKYICSYAGPFEALNEDLHVDMCNFRQKLLKPGVRGAMFIPRSHFKSTIVTEGGSAWEILRNPNIRIKITNAIADKASDFMVSVEDIFSSNDLIRWLYGQVDLDGESYVPTSTAEDWNKNLMVMQNRTKKYREATIETGGTGGAAEGHHHDLHVVDDMIGLAALNAGRQANAVMESTRNWFWGNEDTLLTSPRHGRVIVVGTRYTVDDVYSDIIDRAHKVYGYPLKEFEIAGGLERNPAKHKWVIYYRKAIEDGKIIFPENFTKEDYEIMAEEKWWEYVTQYLNDPQESGLAELNEYRLKTFEMEKENQTWLILDKVLDPAGNWVDRKRELSEFDIVMAIDPAATEKYISAKTSRSAVIVVATDCYSNRYVIALFAGYVPVSTLFDKAFNFAEQFTGYIRATYLESNAGFKVLGPLMRDEQHKRNIYLGLKPFPSVGDKDARIRSDLQTEFQDGRIYALEGYLQQIQEEQMAFPQSNKKDILDALSTAVRNGKRPMNPLEQDRRDQIEERFKRRRGNVTGYGYVS